MTQVGDAANVGDKELSKDWPITSGLTGGTEKQEGRKPYLEPEEANLIPVRDRIERRA